MTERLLVSHYKPHRHSRKLPLPTSNPSFKLDFWFSHVFTNIFIYLFTYLLCAKIKINNILLPLKLLNFVTGADNYSKISEWLLSVNTKEYFTLHKLLITIRTHISRGEVKFAVKLFKKRGKNLIKILHYWATHFTLHYVMNLNLLLADARPNRNTTDRHEIHCITERTKRIQKPNGLDHNQCASTEPKQ